MKKCIQVMLVALVCGSQVKAQFFKNDEAFAHTFSIVARDPQTGEMAVGVQSHWFSVGTAVPWGEAGVGVVATQSFVNKSYGPLGLQLMKNGVTATDALQQLLDKDGGKEVRQVAMIDAKGNVNAYTGKNCIDYANHIVGNNFSVQSNMMLNNTICKAMAAAYEKNSDKPLAERVLAALQAAQQAGGDIRGKQSAAILVVAAQASAQPWNDKRIDIRVDDNATPLVELARLLKLYRAYEHMDKGDLASEKNDMPLAMKEYGTAMSMFPKNLEMQYWTAITLANNKKIKEAAAILQKIYKQDNNWRLLTQRLPKVGLLNTSADDYQLLIK